MKFPPPIIAWAACAAIVSVSASTALAQRQPPPTPEQRLDRLERQVQQVQRQVFPKGRPADTAGFSNEPAATQSSVVTLDQRLDALERQVADMLRQSEESGHRLQTIESDLGRFRSDEQQRLSTLEQRINDAAAAAAAAPAVDVPPPSTKPAARPANGKPKPETASVSEASTGEAPGVAQDDPGEDAYSQGFRLWDAGQYDEAITTLRAFTAAYPKHRRASYANNLIGRALIEKGQLQEAARVLLANYRNNPAGARAQDSLYYLGQAEMKLGQPGQACKAYAELDAVYGASIRPELKKLETDAKSQAQCA